MTTERRHLEIAGLVQGVGFRPFVYRLARDFGLCGWVSNDTRGVRLEVQGERRSILEFVQRLQTDKPAHASISSLFSEIIPLQQESDFSIRPSAAGARPSATLLPDLAPCDDCLRELFDPADRRYRYPFTNCSHCGPRFSIVERLPYDRANTSMKDFPLCAACQREYADPLDRRFHAEPNACPACGPELTLSDAQGRALARGDAALLQAVQAVDTGRIVALKSVGGFQLLVDAANAAAVSRLRQRKQRPHKPFALLYPDIESVQRDCHVSALEKSLLSMAERPIVLLSARPQARLRIARGVAPRNPDLGIMLPCSPLHYLLMAELGRPLVATSGNLSGEPICRDNREAPARLGAIADLFLWHNRPITRPLDDSVVRVIDGRETILRRARGFAPRPLALPRTLGGGDMLAVGGDVKNAPAVARDNTVYLGPHIGDLEHCAALVAFEQAIADLKAFYQCAPQRVVCDLHPGYVSSRWARRQRARAIGTQHHVAHLFSCMAEHDYVGPALGICWDGTGYGADGVIRGGEFLSWDGDGRVRHVGNLRAFPLPGGEAAIRTPRRQAAGLLYTTFGSAVFAAEYMSENFSPTERAVLARMLERRINTPLCTSGGRLFDGVAALLDPQLAVSFEGQAAMGLEFAARDSHTDRDYPFALRESGDHWTLDWAPMIAALLGDGARGVSAAERAAVFHNTLARMMLAVAAKAGHEHVFLSGGVFQNRRLTETAARLLRHNGFRVHCHRQVPPNDGGIALGQICYAACMDACGSSMDEGGALCV
ncbi:carbamoyltransferase HypF [Microbulbifer magnicolonia]|uniref:carbamoyltransferase HypF n=1 Tax=Microbulbifer magnicolonia TaxID=3109744 RepID=UPI002B407795|nr:carbamoyltransferase HypF [Microbulbifer sp. GG15]